MKNQKYDREVQKFLEFLRGWYRDNARFDLPWRRSEYLEPYFIAVSEIMLQQTQVSRVASYFARWIERFPNVESLAAASLSEVLVLWQGLGYNNRGMRLQKMAQVIHNDFDGIFPDSVDLLKKLPGIGDYTAGAVGAFARNRESVFIETNIRRVVLYHFYRDRDSVTDSEVLSTLGVIVSFISKYDFDARNFYWAMMDYGAYLKSVLEYNPNKQSKHYIKQSRFEGSFRQKRSSIVKLVLKQKSVDVSGIVQAFPNWAEEDVEFAVQALIKDGVLESDSGKIFIKEV